MSRSTAAAVALVSALALAGCGATATPGAPAPSPAGPAGNPTSATSTSSAAPAATLTPSSPAPIGTTAVAPGYSATDVCTYLTSQLPALRAIGSTVGVQANLAGNLAGFFEKHDQPADGQIVDDAAKGQCPAVRTEILTLSGLTSIAEL